MDKINYKGISTIIENLKLKLQIEKNTNIEFDYHYDQLLSAYEEGSAEIEWRWEASALFREEYIFCIKFDVCTFFSSPRTEAEILAFKLGALEKLLTFRCLDKKNQSITYIDDYFYNYKHGIAVFNTSIDFFKKLIEETTDFKGNYTSVEMLYNSYNLLGAAPISNALMPYDPLKVIFISFDEFF